MAEIYTSMEYRKFISEEIKSGVNEVTYLGYADYEKSLAINKGKYKTSADKAKKIWRIKKVVKNTNTGITETFYPDGEPAKLQIWNNRASLDYV